MPSKDDNLRTAPYSVAGFCPVPPVPKGRPRFNSKTQTTYTPKETLEYEEAVRAHFISRYGLSSEPMDGPLLAVYEFILPRPKSISRKAVHSSTKPDIDNFVKSFQDALDFKRKSRGGIALGVIANDSRISVLASAKRYAGDGEAAGTRYRIQRLSASMAILPDGADPLFAGILLPSVPTMPYSAVEELAAKLESGKAGKGEREAAEKVRTAFIVPPPEVACERASELLRKAFPKLRSIHSTC